MSAFEIVRLANLPQVGRTISNKVYEYLIAEGVEVPGECYLGAGEIAWDKPGLVTTLAGLNPGQPGRPDASGGYPDTIVFTVQFHVVLLREASVQGYLGNGYEEAQAPDTDLLDYQGEQSFSDLQGLARSLMLLRSNADIVPRSIPMAVGPILPVGPQGNMIGTLGTLNFSVA